MRADNQGYVFDGQAGSALLLQAQIRAGLVFPKQMQAWMERHTLALTVPAKPRRIRNRQNPRPVRLPPVKPKVGIQVLEHVSRRTGIPVDEIMGRGRVPKLVSARRRIAIILRRLGYSWGKIGLTLERDHATIMNYVTPRNRAG